MILLFKQQNCVPSRAERHSRSEIITPKLVSLPVGTPGLLRNSICCQQPGPHYSETHFAGNGGPCGAPKLFCACALLWRDVSAKSGFSSRLFVPRVGTWGQNLATEGRRARGGCLRFAKYLVD